MVDAQVLKRVSESLKSPNQHTQQWTCVLVKRLANHEATALAILQLKLVPQLVSLSRWVIGFHIQHPGSFAPGTLMFILAKTQSLRWKQSVSGQISDEAAAITDSEAVLGRARAKPVTRGPRNSKLDV
jgi:hypothetical protein